MGWPRRAPNPVRRRVSAPNEHVHVPSSNATIGIDIGKSMPKHCYVYAIDVDGVRRYIGKGSNGRMYAHMKEVRHRLTRKFKLKNVGRRCFSGTDRGGDERRRRRGNRPGRQSDFETSLPA